MQKTYESMAFTIQRFDWIDWMKVIGIYFIVYGHLFSFGEKFIYVFNVPLFFFISGFLCKKEVNKEVFWKKLWYNLVVPMLIISLINNLYYCAQLIYWDSFDFKNLAVIIFNVICGFHSGVHECWFIYTLIVLKIIFQFSSGKGLPIFLFFLFLCIAYLYNHLDLLGISSVIDDPNSIVNVFTAYPFFALGGYVKNHSDFLNKFDGKLTLGVVFVVSLFLIFICGHYNDYVWMWKCGYGGNFVLFLIGGVSGTCCIYALSKILGSCPQLVTTISRGTILILGFNMALIELIRRFFQASLADFGFAFIIVLCFIPVIMLAERFFPLIMGKYRLKKG